MPVAITIKATDPALPAAQTLIAGLDAYQAPMYPAESNHLDAPDTLKAPNVHFLGAFRYNAIIGCGAVKLLTGYGEIKRVYVPPRNRGLGIAKKLMAALEGIIIESHRQWSRLETGIHQPEAIGLYSALGYQHCGPFGDYREDPVSVFMQKKLTSD